MSTLSRSDPVADCILDFVAWHESAGNYNAVIGNAHATADLSMYPVAGIYALQDRLVASGRPSSAVGRYQIIKATLTSLVASKRIDTAARFTPALQDQLGVALLNKRGHQDWLNGDIDDAEYAHRLSLEWASLPDPQNDGRSHYDGVGPNHAGTTLADVYSMLARARALHDAPPSPPAPPLDAALIASVRDAAGALRDALDRLASALNSSQAQ